MVIVLGLTGSIGMGKSTAASALRRLGVPVHDADATVHGLMGRGGRAVAAVAAAFPGAVVEGAVDRAALGTAVFGDPAALARLEGILHPLVRESGEQFLRRHRRRRTPLVCLDIPLLFETGGDQRCDFVAVVSAPPAIQRQRVMRRRGMSGERFAAVLAAQLPDREKRRRADFVVQTGLGKHESLRRLAAIVRLLRDPDARARRRKGRRPSDQGLKDQR